MNTLILHLKTQKTTLETLQAQSAEHQATIRNLLRVNREAFKDAEHGRKFEAHVQSMFAEAVLTAIRDGDKSSFRRIVEVVAAELG